MLVLEKCFWQGETLLVTNQQQWLMVTEMYLFTYEMKDVNPTNIHYRVSDVYAKICLCSCPLNGSSLYIEFNLSFVIRRKVNYM